MSSIKFDPFSRRTFIKGVGGFMAIPFLESLVPLSAQAAGINNQRLVVITTPNQFPSQLLFPNGYYGLTTPTDIAGLISKKSDGTFPYNEFSLSNIIGVRGQISGALDSKFNPYASKMALYRGLDMPGRVDHGRAISLGNIAASHLGANQKIPPNKTMDEFLMNSSNFYPNGKSAYKFPILRLGEASISTDTLNPLDSTVGQGLVGNNAKLTRNSNLKTIFDEMYANSNVNSSNPAAKIPVVDRLLASVNTLKNSRKLGLQDKYKLDAYMSSLSELETSLANSPVVPTGKPNWTILNQNAAYVALGELANGVQLTDTYYKDCARLISLAIQVGSTKLATVGIGSALDSAATAVTQNGAIRDWHIKYAHGNDLPKLLMVNKNILDTLFFNIIKNLDQVESNGLTYLDNTLVYFTSELSFGHSGIGLSGVLAGNSQGGLALGKGFEYADWARSVVKSTGTPGLELAPGQPINRLWVGILHSLGLIPSDYLGLNGSSNKTFGYNWGLYSNSYESIFGEFDRSANISKSLPGLFSK